MPVENKIFMIQVMAKLSRFPLFFSSLVRFCCMNSPKGNGFSFILLITFVKHEQERLR